MDLEFIWPNVSEFTGESNLFLRCTCKTARRCLVSKETSFRNVLFSRECIFETIPENPEIWIELVHYCVKNDFKCEKSRKWLLEVYLEYLDPDCDYMDDALSFLGSKGVYDWLKLWYDLDVGMGISGNAWYYALMELCRGGFSEKMCRLMSHCDIDWWSQEKDVCEYMSYNAAMYFIESGDDICLRIVNKYSFRRHNTGVIEVLLSHGHMELFDWSEEQGYT